MLPLLLWHLWLCLWEKLLLPFPLLPSNGLLYHWVWVCWDICSQLLEGLLQKYYKILLTAVTICRNRSLLQQNSSKLVKRETNKKRKRVVFFFFSFFFWVQHKISGWVVEFVLLWILKKSKEIKFTDCSCYGSATQRKRQKGQGNSRVLTPIRENIFVWIACNSEIFQILLLFILFSIFV